MTITRITTFIRHCNGHSPISQNPEFREKLNFFTQGVPTFHKQPLSVRHPLMTTSPVGVRDMRSIFERTAISQSSQAHQKEMTSPSEMFWGMSTRLSSSMPRLELPPLSAEVTSSMGVHPISEKADKGKAKAFEPIREEGFMADAFIAHQKETALDKGKAKAFEPIREEGFMADAFIAHQKETALDKGEAKSLESVKEQRSMAAAIIQSIDKCRSQLDTNKGIAEASQPHALALQLELLHLRLIAVKAYNSDPRTQQLEEFCLQLNAKDHDGQYKRAKGHYFALQGQQLVWKPFHKEGKWRPEERVEAKKALLHLLDLLEQAEKDGFKEINDGPLHSAELEEITLNGVLEKVINRQWCKSLLTDKVVKQRFMDVFYSITFKSNLDSAREVDSCLHEIDPALNDIIRILSSIQRKSLLLVMKYIYDEGSHKEGENKEGSKRAEEESRFAQVLDKTRSPVIRQKMEEQLQTRLTLQADYEIYQKGLNRLTSFDRLVLLHALGMDRIYRALTPDQHELYFQDLIQHRDRITVYNGRSLVEAFENLKECRRLPREELDLHGKWSEDPQKNLQMLISTLPERPKARALQALADNDFGSVIAEIFGTGNKMGNVREMLSTSLLEIYIRSLSHLKPHLEASQIASYEKKTELLKGHIQWDKIPSLFNKLAHDMKAHGLG